MIYFVLVVSFLILPLTATAKETRRIEIISFVIPQERADLSLTQFAEQANLTLIFPFDIVEKKTTNRLVGSYSITDGLKILLADTGLKAKVERGGKLSIYTDDVREEEDSIFNKNKLASAIILATASLGAQSETAKDGSDSVAIEEVVVTGSYIRGANTAAANPVSVLTAEDMKYTGGSDITDLLNNMSINSGAENRPDTFTSFYNQGTSNVNLRGLGLSSTLVLINGKRQTLSGAKTQDGSVFVDTASIPAIAIKRIEVLKEGAAATYGSDAVAGVVNFTTHDDFDGFTIEGSYHTIEGFDQNDKNVNLLGGFDVGENTHVVLAAAFLRRSNLRGYEKPELIGNAHSGFGTTFELTEEALEESPDNQAYVEDGPWAGTYGQGEAGHPDCESIGGIPMGVSSNVDESVGAPSTCRYRYGMHYNIVNEEEREQYYGSLTHDFGGDVQLKIAAFYSNYEIIDNYSVPSLPNLNFSSVAADNPTNPFGVDVVIKGRHNPTLDLSQSRAAPRDNETFRIEGNLSGEFRSEWSWNTSLAYSANEYSITQPEMLLPRLILAINGQGGVTGDQTFNHFETDPSQHDLELLDWLKTDFKSDTITTLLVLDGVVSGEWFELSAGAVSVAFGGQVRKESYEVDPNDVGTIVYDDDGNPDSSANQFTFLGPVSEVDESRTAFALFAETEIPLTEKVTVSAAIRYENLDTATSTDPKLAIIFEATDNLSFRTSVSTSFREPSLSQFNADNVNTANIADPLNTDTGIFIRVTTTGNEDLEPEQATNYNLGGVWSSDSLEVRLDYWRVDYKDVITIESGQAKINADPNGPTVVRQNPDIPNSTLAGISTDYFNAANIDASGLDFETTYTTDVADGVFELGFGLAHYLKYEVPGPNGSTIDAVGSFNKNNFVRSMPATKFNLSAHWQNDSHSIYSRLNHVSSYSYKTDTQDDKIDSFMPVDLQYRYTFSMDSDAEIAVSLGINNVFDEAAPEVRDGANFSYDPKHHDPRGRIFYVKGQYTF